METALALPAPRTGLAYLAEEAACILFGAALTFGLFFALARFENARPPAAAEEVEDLRSVAALVEPPPPKVEPQPDQPDVVVPLAGIEIAPADSPVKLAVVPPDLAKILPTTELPPRATIQFGQLLTDLRPHAGTYGDLEHIFQQNEVDQVPVAVVKTIARVPSRVHDNVDQLRVTLVLVIEASGAISSIKVIRPSANPKFDAIVTDCVVNEWQFTPAVRKGKQVRCMVQQLVWYKWTGGGKFTL
jgi:outer membrane biosynthesis protein TonB